MGYLDNNGLSHFWEKVKGYVNEHGGTGDTTFLVKAPVGTIVIWSGTQNNIHTGWALCDGQNGRPDLRDKFVLGAGTTHAVGETGGSEEVTLTVEQMPSHNHSTAASSTVGTTNAIYPRGNSNSRDGSSTTNSSGSSKPHPNMPPYYTLCYIIKVTADETDGVTLDQVQQLLAEKQDTITGTAGQVVGFDAEGKAVAQERGEVYSNEETIVGRWIDGRPIYQKTFTATTSSSGTFPKIEIPDMETVIYFFGNIRRSDGYEYPLPAFYSATDFIGVARDVYPRGTFLFNPSSGVKSVIKNSPFNFTVKYTKTTDQATIELPAMLSARPAVASMSPTAVSAGFIENEEV